MPHFWTVFFLILVGLVLGGILALLVRDFRDIRAARRRVRSMGSQVVQTPCGLIEYARSGKGYPLLVVHGAIGGFDQGLFLAKSFDFPNCEIISVSRFGHLRTPLPKNADLNMQADAYAGLLDALMIRQTVVFAISSGATSAIRFTAGYSDRVSALVLMCPEAPGEIQMTQPPRFVFDKLFRSDFFYWFMITYLPKTMQDMMMLVPKGFALTPEYSLRVKNILQGDLPIRPRADGLVFESYTVAPEMNESVLDTSPFPLREIKTPVLVLNALDDPITIPENVKALADKIPSARLFTVPDSGHSFFGHSQELKSEIVTFLRKNVVELDKGKASYE